MSKLHNITAKHHIPDSVPTYFMRYLVDDGNCTHSFEVFLVEINMTKDLYS